MHLALIDCARGYTADRPEKNQPFGGTNTAVCFLARALTDRGVRVTLFNQVTEPSEALGIKSLPLTDLIKAREDKSYSAFIFCGRWTDNAVLLVAEKATAPLIAWMHESLFEEGSTTPHEAFHAVVFVSNWQARINQSFCRPSWKQSVIRNAMNPLVETAFKKNEPLLKAKKDRPLAIYSGMPPRGVLTMLALWPYLQAAHKEWELAIFCNPGEGLGNNEELRLKLLFRALPGLIHLGPVGQKEHCETLKKASLLLMPNPYPETSCITLIEALASGMAVVTTARAALTETASGFAELVEIGDADEPKRYDLPIDLNLFLSASHKVMDELERKEPKTEARLQKQRAFFLKNYLWSQRAKSWIDFITNLSVSSS